MNDFLNYLRRIWQMTNPYQDRMRIIQHTRKTRVTCNSICFDDMGVLGWLIYGLLRVLGANPASWYTTGIILHEERHHAYQVKFKGRNARHYKKLFLDYCQKKGAEYYFDENQRNTPPPPPGYKCWCEVIEDFANEYGAVEVPWTITHKFFNFVFVDGGYIDPNPHGNLPKKLPPTFQRQKIRSGNKERDSKQLNTNSEAN